MFSTLCTLYSVQCTVYNVQYTMYNVYTSLYRVSLHVMNMPWVFTPLYTVHQYTVHSTLYTEHRTLYTVHRTQYTVHQYTVYSTPYTEHRTLYTVHCRVLRNRYTQYTRVHGITLASKLTTYLLTYPPPLHLAECIIY